MSDLTFHKPILTSSRSFETEIDERNCYESDGEYYSAESTSDQSDFDIKSLSGSSSEKSSINDQLITGIHPLDCLLALIYCSDAFLCQDLFSRLAKCQLAVPLVLPSIYSNQCNIPLWGLRSIMLEWKKLTKGNKIRQFSSPLLACKSPIVSFIRIGSVIDVSKSKTLNNVISDRHHECFFSRESSGGQYKRILGNGLIDMSWYLPSGRTNDIFSKALIFLNLHGDSKVYPIQINLIAELSNLCVLFLPKDTMEFDEDTKNIMKKLDSKDCYCIIINTSGDTLSHIKDIKAEFKKLSILDIKEFNPHIVKNDIRKQIRNDLQRKRKNTFPVEYLLSQLSQVACSSIQINECGSDYKTGKDSADKIMQEIKNCITEGTFNKDRLLPLQRKDMWTAWTEKDKEIHRHIDRRKDEDEHKERHFDGGEQADGRSITRIDNATTARIGELKKKIRKDQLSLINDSPISFFYKECIPNFKGQHIVMARNFFLQSLKLELYILSSKMSTEKEFQYSLVQTKLQAKRNLHESEASKECIELQERLKTLEKDMIQSTFSLDYIFREVGQVYEAEEQQLAHVEHDYLPEWFANLFIEGHPLELMDGNTGHVPITWVTAVLQAATELLGNPKVFVLSVLGVQSSGKSTMLNTTFGIKFRVSAGRCTRGAFMQLVLLDDETKQLTECDYMLVVDTEGLRSPHIIDPVEAQKHDNELATFVIGLADVCLININGEVPGDIDNILQTSVHAFLRMSEIKYKPNCQFVHQNTINDPKYKLGQLSFLERLDQFTAVAAQEEHCANKYQCFNDVIEFNSETDIHHFPGLWEGCPPMASIEQGYSMAAQSLKQKILNIAYKKSQTKSLCSCTSLSEFVYKVEDLWTSLLQEDFVFSFKNSIEINAYNSLEDKYSTWEFTFIVAIATWERETKNIICPRNYFSSPLRKKEISKSTSLIGSDQATNHTRAVSFISLKEEKLTSEIKDLQASHSSVHSTLEDFNLSESESESEEQSIEDMVEERIEKLKELVSALLKERQLEMKNYFDSNQKDIIVQWKGRFEKKLLTLSEELEEKAIKQCHLLLKSRLNIAQFEEDKLKNIHFIKKEVRKHIKSIKKHQDKIQKSIKNRDLSLEDLKELNEQDLFTQEKLLMYQKLGFVSKEQVMQISTVIADAGEAVTEMTLKNILLGDFIKEEQVMMILRRVEQSDDVLKKKFEAMWSNELKHLDSMPPSATVPIKKRVEEDLIKFVKGQNSKLLKEKLQEKTLEEWGDHLSQNHTNSFRENIKYMCQWVVKLGNDNHEIGETTLREIRQEVHIYLESVVEYETDYDSLYTQELLRNIGCLLDKKDPEYITYSQERRFEAYLMACGYSIPMFEDIAKKFREDKDPREYLNKMEKDTFFVRFKTQYTLTNSEDAIADILCAYVAEPIRKQARESLSLTMMKKIKGSSKSYFQTKVGLKVKVLIDLLHTNSFEEYMNYLSSPSEFLKKKLNYYIIQYCDHEIGDSMTRLHSAVSDEISSLIKLLQTAIDNIDESENIKAWWNKLCQDQRIQDKLGLKLKSLDLLADYELSDLEVTSLQDKIIHELDRLNKKLLSMVGALKCADEIQNWQKDINTIFKKLIGCTHQCPFCGELCDYSDEHTDAIAHKTDVHRMDGLKGWRWLSTKNLSTDCCSALICSDVEFQVFDTGRFHPYKEYQKIYKNWFIRPDTSADCSLYWQRFIGEFGLHLAKYYKVNSPKISAEWFAITKQEVEKNLLKLYKLKRLPM